MIVKSRRQDRELLKVMGGYYALSAPVFVMWNRFMNDDDWSTALWHGSTFSVMTGSVVLLWFLRRSRRVADAVPGGRDG